MPTIINTAKANVRAAGTTGITVTHGLTLVDNDILYAIIAQGDNSGTATASSSGGTWSEIAFISNASGDDRMLSALRRVVTNAAGEPSTYTFTVNNATTMNLVAIVVQVRQGDTTTPEDATPTINAGTNDFTPANIGITTVTDNALVIIAKMCSLADGAAAGKTAGAPSGWTLVDSEKYTAGTAVFEVMLEVASLVQTTAGVVTPGSWTSSPDDALAEWATLAIAVRPGAVPQTIVVDAAAISAFEAIVPTVAPGAVTITGDSPTAAFEAVAHSVAAVVAVSADAAAASFEALEPSVLAEELALVSMLRLRITPQRPKIRPRKL